MELNSPGAGEAFAIDAVDAFRKYSDMVYRLAYTRTKSRSDSDDILQEVFLRLLRHKPYVENDEHLKATLIRMTVNCSKSFLTSSWFKNTAPLTEALAAADAPETDETLECVMSLSTKNRIVIHLFYYCGYSVNEIASILECSEAAVKTRLSRARIVLKKKLEGVDFDVS